MLFSISFKLGQENTFAKMQYSYNAALATAQLVDWIESEMDSDATPNQQHATMAFLLKTGPLLKRYEDAKRKISTYDTLIAHPCAPNTMMVGHGNHEIDEALTECYNIHQEFLQYCSPGDVVQHHDEFPIYCEECGSDNSFVDDRENAINVCTVCGIEQRYDIAPGKAGLSHADQLRRAPVSYVYDPIKYFRKCLDEVQGVHRGTFPPWLLDTLRNDFRIRGINSDDVNPTEVRASLKRLRCRTFYPNRWILAKRLNPRYMPIQMPHELVERLVAFFQGMTTRFRHVIKTLHLQRRNLPSIPTFTRTTLLQWGYPRFAEEFPPLKSISRQKLQALILKLIFVALDVRPIPKSTPLFQEKPCDLPIRGQIVNSNVMKFELPIKVEFF